MQKDQSLAIAVEENLSRLLRILEEEGEEEWKIEQKEKEKEGGGGMLSIKKVEDSSIHAIKVEGRVENKKPEDLISKIWDFRKSEWKKWLEHLEEWQIIEEVDENARIIRQAMHLPWPLKNRELVLAQIKMEKGGKHLLFMFSVEHSAVPQNEKKFVRAQMLNLLQLQENGDDTIVTRVVHINPGGSIPTSLINAKTVQELDILNQLREL